MPTLAHAMLVAALLQEPAAASATVTLRGRVVDARTGEPLAKALVTLPALARETRTDSQGAFSVSDLAAGDVEIVVTTVGYGLVRKLVHAGPDASPLEIQVGQEALKRTEELV